MFDTIVTMHYGTEYKKTNRINSHPSIHCPTSGASERVSGASERANGRASDPVLLSVFLAVIDHSASGKQENTNARK